MTPPTHRDSGKNRVGYHCPFLCRLLIPPNRKCLCSVSGSGWLFDGLHGVSEIHYHFQLVFVSSTAVINHTITNWLVAESLAHSYKHTLTHTLTHSNTHTLTHTHTYTHTHTLSLSLSLSSC